MLQLNLLSYISFWTIAYSVQFLIFRKKEVHSHISPKLCVFSISFNILHYSETILWLITMVIIEFRYRKKITKSRKNKNWGITVYFSFIISFKLSCTIYLFVLQCARHLYGMASPSPWSKLRTRQLDT